VPEAVISVKGLRKSYGELEALRGIDLDVARGEVVAVLGASGSGKTTLLRACNYLTPFSAGEAGFMCTRPVQVGFTSRVISS